MSNVWLSKDFFSSGILVVNLAKFITPFQVTLERENYKWDAIVKNDIPRSLTVFECLYVEQYSGPS